MGRHYVGIDENGMGPRLGPMVVTSILAEVSGDESARLMICAARGALAKRIGDSKKLISYDDNALGEAWARAIVTRADRAAATPRELLGSIMLDGENTLRDGCPSHHAELCWGTDGEGFTAPNDLVRTCDNDLVRLEDRGVRVLRARVAIVCTRRLNDAVVRGLSRFDLDLHTMERLVLAARGDANAEIYAICGKVGGFHFYGDRFGPLADRPRTTLIEGRARSEYEVPDVGRLAFVRDADDSHAIVALASLVGKWVRDHFMRRIVRYHQMRAPHLPNVSGYHDPVTAHFIEASALVRKAQCIEDACFERISRGRKTTSSMKGKAPAR